MIYAYFELFLQFPFELIVFHVTSLVFNMHLRISCVRQTHGSEHKLQLTSFLFYLR